ncbi:MarR family winged helix-turn-helix transcriptional regulator [Nocardioides luteus]|uniref:MarR family winged helix-turn-helix transcriptional regulator n=1 Tax=Nocardioides luteus TaxID=1844 RepID=UPI0018CB0DCA|nr:MarR family transcriptional regulator [Nocardioides luteus]MBG6097654.1 DNA-binding MarR family transcriptional regulator [Nocardioides luteus]
MLTCAAEELADLAEIVATLARDIERHHARDPEITELSTGEHAVMRYVDRHPGATPSEIAQDVGMQRPNLSATLRKLEDKGMVVRSEGIGDRRGKVVTPTPYAAENLRRLRAVWSDALAPAAGEPDLAGLTARLTAIRDLLAADRGRLRAGSAR